VIFMGLALAMSRALRYLGAARAPAQQQEQPCFGP
jgi:hypothetical protein